MPDYWLIDSKAAQSAEASLHPTPRSVLRRVIATKTAGVPRLMEDLLDEIDWTEYDPPLYRQEWSRIIRY